MDTVWMGSDFDGAFAEYVTVPAGEAFPVDCDWTDAELGAIPCAYGTAENMLHRAGVTAGDHVLVTGASGGVGSATVQLAHRRGARVTAITSPGKADAVRHLGADEVLARDADLPSDVFDVAVDNVAGAGFGAVLSALRRGGRYVSSGAIAGAVVDLDMRTMYLRDLRLIGCTAWDEPVFPNLIGYISAARSGRWSPRPSRCTTSWRPSNSSSARNTSASSCSCPDAVGTARSAMNHCRWLSSCLGGALGTTRPLGTRRCNVAMTADDLTLDSIELGARSFWERPESEHEAVFAALRQHHPVRSPRGGMGTGI